jgi:hypothetical protein
VDLDRWHCPICLRTDAYDHIICEGIENRRLKEHVNIERTKHLVEENPWLTTFANKFDDWSETHSLSES